MEMDFENGNGFWAATLLIAMLSMKSDGWHHFTCILIETLGLIGVNAIATQLNCNFRNATAANYMCPLHFSFVLQMQWLV